MRLALVLLTASIASAQFFPFPGPGRQGSGGGGGGASATFQGIQTAASGSASATTIAAPALTVTAGDLLVVFAWGASSIDTTGVVCGSDTLTSDKSWINSGYLGRIWYKVNAASSGSTTCTATYTSATGYRVIMAANYTITGGSATLQASTCNTSSACTALEASSTNRTSANLTTSTANTLQIAAGIDWSGGTINHTAAGGYTLRLDGSSTPSDVQFYYDRVVTSTGTYPSGNFGTTSTADQYMTFFITFGLT